MSFVSLWFNLIPTHFHNARGHWWFRIYQEWSLTEAVVRSWCHFLSLKGQPLFFDIYCVHVMLSASLDSSTLWSPPRLHLRLPDWFPAASQELTMLQAVSLATLCQFYKLSCSNLGIWQPPGLIYSRSRFFRIDCCCSSGCVRFLPIWGFIWSGILSLSLSRCLSRGKYKNNHVQINVVCCDRAAFQLLLNWWSLLKLKLNVYWKKNRLRLSMHRFGMRWKWKV